MSERSSDQRQVQQGGPRRTGIAFVCATLLFSGGCSQFRPHVPQSEGHIAAPSIKSTTTTDIPPPARVSTFVPPPVAQIKPQTYSVVVHDVPVRELLLALARDTKRNIDIHPGINGLVSLNAINETLDAILERVGKQVNMRYRTEGNTIIVSRDTPYVKTYRVNYVNTARTITSTINVTGEVGSSGSSANSSSGGSKTEVTSKTSNDFWEQLKDNINSILISTRRITATDDEKAERAQEERSSREAELKRIEAASRAGAGASALIQSAAPTQRPATAPQTDVGKDVIVNPMSGTITVLATDKQHELIQRHMDSVINSMQRQVLIEATIVEVRLSNAYQAGIDWSRIAGGTGFTIQQTLLGGFGTGLAQTGNNLLQVGYSNPTSSVGNISGTVKLLQEFGDTRVLSSPKLMALNNQTALLKVVDNLVYFEVKANTTTPTTGPAVTTFDTTAKTVSVGFVMGVTPQINEDGRVTLIVRPTISRQFGPGKPDPNPALVIQNLVPEIQVREMESVLQVSSGQTAILGGLMEDNTEFNREQIPGADVLSGGRSIGGLGDLFRYRDERATKTELVIFLKPTVVPNPSLESDELKFFQRFLPQAESRPAPPPPAR